MEIPNEYRKCFFRLIFAFLIVVSIYFIVKSFSEFKTYESMENKVVNTIVVSGHGEINAVPDIANISFTITKDAKTVKEAQNDVAQIEKKALDFLKGNNIADKDIKTSNSSFYPKYEYKYTTTVMMPCTQYGCPPNPGKNVIVGYTATESINIKIRNTDNVGKVAEGLGSIGVGELNGPNFAIDNEDGLKVDARKKAIDDAKSKASVLAKDLGVHLVKIVSFSDSNNNYPVPMYAKTTMMAGAADVASDPAQIPTGENTISSDVTITYEIK